MSRCHSGGEPTSATTSTPSSPGRGANRARVIILNSPNNPTGSALPAGRRRAVPGRDRGPGVCDEAYQEFGGPSAVPLLRRPRRRLVVLRTFSKAMGMAGLTLRVRARPPGHRARDRQGQAAVQRQCHHPGRRRGGPRRGRGRSRSRRRAIRERERFRSTAPDRFRGSASSRVRPTSSWCAASRCRRRGLPRLHRESRDPGPRRLGRRRAGRVSPHLGRHHRRTWTP